MVQKNICESKYICPPEFSPVSYHRYIDDTYTSFSDISHAQLFLNHINLAHPNIKFTMELESDNKISFLDILITKQNNKITTNVFRKLCFTGLGLNYYSFCPESFKINSCKTLIHRAFSICSNWSPVHFEFVFLENYFKQNCYPKFIFQKTVNKFLNNVFHPQIDIPTVPKLIKYLSFPYLGSETKKFEKQLSTLLIKHFPFLDLKLIFTNPYKIGTFF